MTPRKLPERKTRRAGIQKGRREDETLLISGEGPVEQAFLNHMSDLFKAEGLAIKIVPASGGSPLDILKEAKSRKHAKYDRYYAVIDTDVPIDDPALAYARREQITVITSSPVCLECMLLKELGEKVRFACACQACKDQLYPMIKNKPTKKDSYKELFNKQVLESFKHPAIKDLIALMKNTNRENNERLVKDIQSALIKLNLFSDQANGVSSPGIKKAIKKFQKQKNLYESGELSEGLLAMMKDEIKGVY